MLNSAAASNSRAMTGGVNEHPPWSLYAVAEHLGIEGAEALLDARGSALVTGICQDSRRVCPGDVYAALPGHTYHGGEFVAEAARRGAVAVISDRPTEVLPTIVVEDPRRILGPLASWIHHHPSAALDVYGVTGTNGKTSTAYLLEAGLAAAGLRTGMVSGITIRGPDGVRVATRTTPEACKLQQTLAAFAKRRVQSVAMEVSSHGLALHRIDGTLFRVAVFTNLARDHLDFHANMTAYYEAKARLFTPEHCAAAVIGIDDVYGKSLAARVAVPRLTFSSHDAAADVFATDVKSDHVGTSFTLCMQGRSRTVRLSLLGNHQVDNALAAIAALSVGEVDLAAALGGMERLDSVPGRLDRVEAGQDFLAFVDYVHNPSAQHRLFPYLRSLAAGRIIVVIGATGGRDPGKREPLGFVAASYADVLIVTDESPFSDNAQKLRHDVASGARKANHAEVMVIPDRSDAIRAAVARATTGDVVVVTGRGHDPVMNYDGEEIAFDDRRALERALIERAVR